MGSVVEHVSKEALRYLQNAREILAKIPVEDNIYTDVKPVREAMGTAYFALLEAINEALIRRGVDKNKLPKSVDAYREALRKRLIIRDGKLLREFEILYDELHIAGYYRGALMRVIFIKEIIKATRAFIEKVKITAL